MNSAASRPPDSDRALFGLWALFWLLMAVVAVEDHRGDTGVRWWEPLLWEGSSALAATLWLLAERRAARRWKALLDRPARWFGKHLLWLPLVAASFVVAIYSIRHGVYALTSEIYEHPSWPFLFFYETVKVLLFATLWVCIAFGLESFAQWRSERERLLVLQKHLAESQLERLRAQLQPHFLFNTLNTISSLMQVDVARADRLLTRLADLLRASLTAGTRPTTSLRDELELLKLYASIMQERFTDRVALDWDIADDTLAASVPTMLLQPLLENAYKHGVERASDAVRIRLTTRHEADALHITIHNSGTLGTRTAPGIGLANCRERLALVYGARATLELSGDAAGVTAAVRLPFGRHAP